MHFNNSKINKMLYLGTALALLTTFFVAGFHYGSLPEKIPIHFNVRGEADSHGAKSTLWIVPVLALFMCVGLAQLSRRLPKMKPNIDERELRITRSVLAILSLLLALSFSYITIRMVLVAITGSGGLGSWFLPVFCAIFVIGPLTSVLLYRKKK